VRQADGLAVSSRNQYLTRQQKKNAPLIYKSLQKCQKLIADGVADSKTIINQMRKILQQAPSIKIEYISIVDADTLQELKKITGKVLTAVAVKIGSTRLIDNILLDVNKR
jgi:pantoate--beta-alanine ligase